MAWRVIEVGEEVWSVSVAAERRANSQVWGLVLSFRSSSTPPKRFWASIDMEATSKAAVYSQAERLSMNDLTVLLNEHMARN